MSKRGLQQGLEFRSYEAFKVSTHAVRPFHRELSENGALFHANRHRVNVAMPASIGGHLQSEQHRRADPMSNRGAGRVGMER